MNTILYKKRHKIKLSCITKKNANVIKYGFYALKAVVPGVLTAKQVEASRRVVSRETKRIGKIFIRVFFNLAKTKKPLLSRMGKGCGPIKKWIAIVQKGTIILELNGVSKRASINALNAASIKLPLKVSVVERAIGLF